MTFTPTQKELFNKNIEALNNILLKESLKEIKSSKFELILGKDNLDINLKDTSIKNNGGGVIMKIYFIKIPLKSCKLC
ncbi:motility associated factor glycosyltransferase family protein [Campylobacter jejuni]|nr:motility accessory factor [Campylobacter jejuni subsp. jejuni NCTC 11168-K12E5]AHK54621.1 motility accessory factor [Campylobacter jejuni subsp. jejuni NCTC 11168-Kf1]AHK56286.1 motility accessory factor [Campylobacter jejuni subsp. jejuni NCTC 11168-mcK12E5]AHK57950.1 motility accessory factor [Campylobacter jejuni subsp. jejuni NCTC 11168-mfK12E5]AHK59619.1 motility accessory factor [Campylobacter jejuni subsp. jejuni NCTC 11168-GSv]ASE87540.1 motility accessory factor [Campylobacter jeju